jgi:hypothetical protein
MTPDERLPHRLPRAPHRVPNALGAAHELEREDLGPRDGHRAQARREEERARFVSKVHTPMHRTRNTRSSAIGSAKSGVGAHPVTPKPQHVCDAADRVLEARRARCAYLATNAWRM